MGKQWGSKGGSDSMSGRQAAKMAREAYSTGFGGAVNGRHRGQPADDKKNPAKGKRAGPSDANQRRIAQATQKVQVTRTGFFGGKVTRTETWKPGKPVPPGYKKNWAGNKIVKK